MVDVLKPVAVVQLTTSYQTIYTCPAATKAAVAFIRVVNVTSTQQSVRLHVTPAAGSEGSQNAIMYDFQIPGNDFIDSAKGMMLAAGDFISALASANVSLNVKVDLIEST